MKTVLSKGSFRERDENEHSILLPDFSTFLIFEQLPKLATITIYERVSMQWRKTFEFNGKCPKDSGVDTALLLQWYN